MFTELIFYNNTSLENYHALHVYIFSGKVVVSLIMSFFYEEADTIHSDCTAGGVGITLDNNEEVIYFMNDSNITGNGGIGNPVIEIACRAVGPSCLLNFNNIYVTNNRLLSATDVI